MTYSFKSQYLLSQFNMLPPVSGRRGVAHSSVDGSVGTSNAD